MASENNAKNVHLNVHPNVFSHVNEPASAYKKPKEKQVDLLILKQLNSIADDMKEIKKKLDI